MRILEPFLMSPILYTPQLTDVFFAELPRIRLDRRFDRPRSRKTIWEPHPNIIHEENEDENGFAGSQMELSNSSLCQLHSNIGEWILWIFIVHLQTLENSRMIEEVSSKYKTCEEMREKTLLNEFGIPSVGRCRYQLVSKSDSQTNEIIIRSQLEYLAWLTISRWCRWKFKLTQNSAISCLPSLLESCESIPVSAVHVKQFRNWLICKLRKIKMSTSCNTLLGSAFTTEPTQSQIAC